MKNALIDFPFLDPQCQSQGPKHVYMEWCEPPTSTVMIYNHDILAYWMYAVNGKDVWILLNEASFSPAQLKILKVYTLICLISRCRLKSRTFANEIHSPTDVGYHEYPVQANAVYFFYVT